MTTKI